MKKNTKKSAPPAEQQKTEDVTIKAPNLRTIAFRVIGTSPYVQHRFAKKAEMMAKMAEGGKSKSKKQRDARDFDRDYQEAMHKSRAGRCGIPAAAFRNAMISACKVAGYVMTRAKLAVFVVPDDIDQDGFPIVHIVGMPERFDAAVRNDSGVADVRSRPMWREWSCVLRVQYDADQLSATDIANLLFRAGMQCGIGEGRHDSKDSCGLGFGCWTIETDAKAGAA